MTSFHLTTLDIHCPVVRHPAPSLNSLPPTIQWPGGKVPSPPQVSLTSSPNSYQLDKGVTMGTLGYPDSTYRGFGMFFRRIGLWRPPSQCLETSLLVTALCLTIIPDFRVYAIKPDSRPYLSTWSCNCLCSSQPAASQFVFIRHDAHCTPLQRPYEGPFKVLQPGCETFKIDIRGKTETITVDRLSQLM